MGLQPGSLGLLSSMSFPPSPGGKEMTVPVCKESVPRQRRKEEHTDNFSLSRGFAPSRGTQSLPRMTTVPTFSSFHLHFVSSLLLVSLKYFIQTESRVNFPKDFVEEAKKGLASQSRSKQSALLIGRFLSPFRAALPSGFFSLAWSHSSHSALSLLFSLLLSFLPLKSEHKLLSLSCFF